MRQLAAGVLVSVALLLAHASASAQTPGARPLRIGFICPFTGGSADFGNSARLGAELAVREINEVGGFLGRPVELVERDDQAKPDVGRAHAIDLVTKEKVDFTIAFCNSGVALKSLDVFQSNKHLLLVPVATGTGITAAVPAEQSYVFRVSVRDQIQASFLVDEIVKKRGFTRVAVFADKTGYGEGGLKDVQAFLAQKKLQPVYVARFDIGVKSLAAEVAQAKAAGAEAVIAYTLGPELAALAQARSEARWSAPLYGPWALSFRSVVENAGSTVEGAMMVQSVIQDFANERRMSFIARLKRQADGKPLGSMMAAAQTYDAVHLMLRVLFQTRGDTSGDALKQALENLDKSYAGVVTIYDHPFSSSDHDAMSRNMVWLGVWHRGEVQFNYPEDAKRSGFVRRKEG
ncbi:MAG TPA: ABC transporter substrate-binding protein [Burkholderiaceae bacterium]|jgi:branched-chain amino acid transport system substrate-binding protein|nr:ABC transporter substrate-binding protein [Burkholderiaceae bacterium]